MRFFMINFKFKKTMISILFLWSAILFATVSENNKKDIVFYSIQGGSSLLISGEAFKKQNRKTEYPIKTHISDYYIIGLLRLSPKTGQLDLV